MGTTLQDTVKQYTDSLQQIQSYTQTAIDNRSRANTTLTNRRDSLSNYSVTFSGLGATAFDYSVTRNVAAAQHLITKIDNVREASEHTLAMINSITSHNDLMLRLPANTVTGDGIGMYGYAILDIQDRIRDGTLYGLMLDAILDPRQDVLDYWVNQMEKEIENEIRAKRNHNVDVINLEPHDPNDPGDVRNNEVKNRIQDEDMRMNSALSEVQRIAKYVHDIMEGWASSLRSITAGYIQSLFAASQVDKITVGEIIDRLTSPDAHGAPIMIWQAPDGSLIVGINDNDKVTPEMVEAAIQQYIEENGLDPSNTNITVVGYLKGGKVAQQVVQDIDTGKNGYKYHIPNVELVGSELDESIAPNEKTEYDAYTFARDLSISGGWGGIFKPDWLSLGTGAAASFATGISLTNLAGAGIADAVSYMTLVGENYDKASGDQAVQTQLNNMDPNHYYTVQNPDKNLDHIQIIPDEPSAHSPSLFADKHYNHSTYLNEIGLPDANQTAQNLPHNTMTRIPTTGALTPPSYFYIDGQNSPPPGSTKIGNIYMQ